MALIENIGAPNGQVREVRSDGGEYAETAIKDARLPALGYWFYQTPDDAIHSIADILTKNNGIGPGTPAHLADYPTARTVVLWFETNGPRLILRGDLIAAAPYSLSWPDQTHGTPYATGVSWDYTVADASLIRFCNATAGQSVTVHMELLA